MRKDPNSGWFLPCEYTRATSAIMATAGPKNTTWLRFPSARFLATRVDMRTGCFQIVNQDGMPVPEYTLYNMIKELEGDRPVPLLTEISDITELRWKLIDNEEEEENGQAAQAAAENASKPDSGTFVLDVPLIAVAASTEPEPCPRPPGDQGGELQQACLSDAGSNVVQQVD